MYVLRRWGLLALAVSVTLAATSLPLPAEVGDPLLAPWADKAVHGGLYLWLGWSLGVGLWEGETPDVGLFLLALAAAAGFAALDEWHQAWIPGRQPELWDGAADLAGATLGLLVSVRWVPGWVGGRGGEVEGRRAGR